MGTIPKAELVCLECPLPECNEKSPGCIYKKRRVHRKGSKWAELFAELAQLPPGGLLIKEVILSEARSARAAVGWQGRQGNLPKFTTWTIPKGADRGLLHFRKRD